MQCAAVEKTKCPRTALRVFIGIPMCLEHIQAMTSELAVVTIERTQELKEGASVVYYIGRRDTTGIKIGVTQNLHKRVRALGLPGRPVRVLATEPGGYYLERKRHRQFSSLRAPGTEWFRESDYLLEHIKNVSKTYGRPRCPCFVATKRRCPAGM